MRRLQTALLGLLLGATVLPAGDILRNGATVGSRPFSGPTTSETAAALLAAQMQRNASDNLARSTRNIQAMREMQRAAAGIAAARGSNHLGVNPFNPAIPLPMVIDGLGMHGLQPAPGAGADPLVWGGAELPVQQLVEGGVLVTVRQTEEKALLTWSSFNVGRRTRLVFDQSAGGEDRFKWIAFNRVDDPSGVPSQILGSIRADGQVYLMNRNGIIFAAGSQIRARSFVASTLPINPNLIENGLLNNPDAQFLFSALTVPGGAGGTPDFIPEAPSPALGKFGDILVQRGARIETTVDAAGSGGLVMLVAPNIRQEGWIATPAGQTILAAGLQVGIAASTDPNLRGLNVFVGEVGNDGVIDQHGLIEADRGNITLAGREINQMGTLWTTTSVDLAGSIILDASYDAVGNPNFSKTGQLGFGGPPFFFQSSGLVRFGPNSVTAVVPEYDSPKTIPGTVLPGESQIFVRGRNIQVEGGAILFAPGGLIDLRAGTWPFEDTDGNRTTLDLAGNAQAGLGAFFTGAEQRFLYDTGRIDIESGAMLSVAGSANVAVALAQNLLTVELRGPELADSPLQRDSFLRGIPLVVDARRTGVLDGRFWVGTPLGDLTGFLNLIERDVGQLTAAGGRINLRAGDSIAVRRGAVLDVSGGFLRHAGGVVETTRLIRHGRLVDIADATPDDVFDGIFTGTTTREHSRWGVSRTYQTPLMSNRRVEAPYIEGAPGGSLSFQAPSMAIDGELRGYTVEGPRQRDTGVEAARLALRFSNQSRLVLSPSDTRFIDSSPFPPVIRFAPHNRAAEVPTLVLAADSDEPLPEARRQLFTVPTSWLGDQNFGHLTVDNPDGDILVPAGVRVDAPARGSVTLRGANISVDGQVRAPGGSLSFTALALSPTDITLFQTSSLLVPAPLPEPTPGRGRFSLGPGAVIDAAGLVVDDRPGSTRPFTQPMALAGGSVRVEAFDVALSRGSRIDVSGGVHARPRGGYTYGNAGSIALLAGVDPGLTSVIGGRLELGASLRGFSGAEGGSLTIQSGLIQVGGAPLREDSVVLSPSFFRTGGFTRYELIGIGGSSDETVAPGFPQPYLPGIYVAPGTVINPVAESLVAVPHPGGNGDVVLRRVQAPVGVRRPVSLSLRAVGHDDPFTVNVLEVRGDVVIGEGARIITDPLASVSLRGQTVSLLGSIQAPGGAVSIVGDSRFPVSPGASAGETFARPTVYLGPQARISVSGVELLQPDARGFRTGAVLPGGQITISGNILAEAGAFLSASGASGQLDFHPHYLNRFTEPLVPRNSGLNSPLWALRRERVAVDSAGGTISLIGRQMLLSDATLMARAGGPRAVGGSLVVRSGRFVRAGDPTTTADIDFTVTQSGPVIPASSAPRGIGLPVRRTDGTPVVGQGYFAADTFAAGGFQNLDLAFDPAGPGSGNIRFEGPVSLNVPGILRLASGGVIAADSPVQFTAGAIAVGQPFPVPSANPPLLFTQDPAAPSIEFNPQATYGPGSLDLRARLIDVGTLVLQNIGEASLSAPGGSVRGSGTVNIRGDLRIEAGQVYPVSASSFNLFALDPPGGQGSITIRQAGVVAAPWVAGGSLNIFASRIDQGGVLRAPFGSIQLGWDGEDLDPDTAGVQGPPNRVGGAGLPAPIAQEIVLRSGSLTSVAGLDENSRPLIIPYAFNPDGLSFIDPRGVNVTLAGLPQKTVGLSGLEIRTQKGSVIDLRGGGDLLAYRTVFGNLGNVDLTAPAVRGWDVGANYEAGDQVNFGGRFWSARARHSGQSPRASVFWREVAPSFAVIPGYGTDYAPFLPFNQAAGDPGLVSPGLNFGDRVFLQGGGGLRAGTYTLLPSRYAVLPGAFLVTPSAEQPIGVVEHPDGRQITTGYRENAFARPQRQPGLYQRFTVLNPTELRRRIEIQTFAANEFLSAEAARVGLSAVQRLPRDAGQVRFSGLNFLDLANTVFAQADRLGRGGMAEVGGPDDIVIRGGSGTAIGGTVLSSDVLSGWGVERLVVSAGQRLVLDNPGAPLVAADLLLLSGGELDIRPGSSLRATGSVSEPSGRFMVSGGGAAVRVSSDPTAGLIRVGGILAPGSLLRVGADVLLAGTSVALDSDRRFLADPNVIIDAANLSFGAGQVSVRFDPAVGPLTGTIINDHLVLEGPFLQRSLASQSLNLSSATTIDLYGGGTLGAPTLANLGLEAAAVRGFGVAGEITRIEAASLLVSNPDNRPQPGAVPFAPGRSLLVSSPSFNVGSNTVALQGWDSVQVAASQGVLGVGDGRLEVAGNMAITTPGVSGTQSSRLAIVAAGDLALLAGAGGAAPVGGLGAELLLEGQRVTVGSDLLFPSGRVVARARAGDLSLGGRVDVSAVSRDFLGEVRVTDAGEIRLESSGGGVVLNPGAVLQLSGTSLGGAAGRLQVIAPDGTFAFAGGDLQGAAVAGAEAGFFVLDVGTLADFDGLGARLNAGGFAFSRQFRQRTGDVVIGSAAGAPHRAREFIVSTDAGDIRVLGTIDASGPTGGSVALVAAGSLTLQPGSLITVRGADFSSSGQGGQVRLEAGAAVAGVADPAAVLDLGAGSTVDLGVDTWVPGSVDTPGSSAFLGRFTGKLHLRAPRNAANNDLALNPLFGTITGASAILAEGYEVTDLTASGGLITGWRPSFDALPSVGTVQRTIYDRSNAFLSVPNYNAMLLRILGADPQGLASAFVLAPGVEIINRTGDLTLGSANSTAIGSGALNSADWNLGDFRFGPKAAPGVLTLRAAGDLVFFNALSDGFTPDPVGAPDRIALPPGTQPGQSLWLSPLARINPALPVNLQSWSMRLAAGGDLGAADYRQVADWNTLAGDSGSLRLGKFLPTSLVSGSAATTATAINNRFAVIRTGTGDIDIRAARDVQMRNTFAAIYTAGVRLPERDRVFAAGDFSVPITDRAGLQHPNQGLLGAVQQRYQAQWGLAGGDLSVVAGRDVRRVTLSSGGDLITDTSFQMPFNYVYRRGVVDPATGLVGTGGVDAPPFGTVNDPAASLAWWIDYSNFFQGLGALGGGDIRLEAGRDVINADAVIPTNARMAGIDPVSGNRIAPSLDRMVELGGGDLAVRAGRDLSGGVYYVERGRGNLFAGGQVTTNAARSPSPQAFANTFFPDGSVVSNSPSIFDPLTWLPTTLMVGKSSFDVRARGDILLGPVTNPFLLPPGLNNKFWYKTWFQTFSPDAGVNAVSFGGGVSHRLSVTLPGGTVPQSLLNAWLRRVNFYRGVETASNISNFQPWVRSADLNIDAYGSLGNLLAPSLRSTAFDGDIQVIGDLNLFPSAIGDLELLASGSVFGLNPGGRSQVAGSNLTIWSSANINVSGADPRRFASPLSPLSTNAALGRSIFNVRDNLTDLFVPMKSALAETGSFAGLAGLAELQRQRNDPLLSRRVSTQPIRIFGATGDVSGFQLFAPKQSRIIAGRDVTDVALYLQNLNPGEISLVAAGRDVLPFNESGPRRSLAADLAAGNLIGDPAVGTTVPGLATQARSGDLQIGGPGALVVIAGRDLDLGSGPNFPDGTGTGLTSIGRFRNPFLPFAGADLIALAGVPGPGGVGPARGLDFSGLDIDGLISGSLDGTLPPTSFVTRNNLNATALTEEQRAVVALQAFFDELRDVGRTNAEEGFPLIETLFADVGPGEIRTRSRDIRTSTGGSILLAAPGGGLTLAEDIFGNPLAPPGIVTEFGGAISILADGNVDIGRARIFTLRGGDLFIWSSSGNIAAGSAPRTVVTAPPTRVTFDLGSAAVTTDLGGLATGGGIGVLASVAGVEPGDVDLIAPRGVVDAGDAGIRVTGNLNIAAVTVLNTGSIQVGGASAGVPAAPAVAAPNIGAATSASATTAATTGAASETARAATEGEETIVETPSIISVEVIGYGGAPPPVEDDEDEQDDESEVKEEDATADPGPASITPVE